MPKKRSKEMKGISRIDSPTTHGWFVRGYRNGKTYSRLFSDRKLGGKTKALASAKTYRDGLLLQIKAIPAQRNPRRLVFKDARNVSGVLGVCRTSKTSPNGTPYECYSVSWRPESGVQKCTSFSIRKYGEEKAFQLAVDHRLKMMRRIHGNKVASQMAPAEKQATAKAKKKAPVKSKSKPAKKRS
jgi:hypothetical protein